MLAETREPIDARILRLAHEGQGGEACRLLVRAYGAEILGTCIARMGDVASGEDAAQDSLARAVVGLDDYRGAAGLRPWLHRIAANRCVDLLRSQTSRRHRMVEAIEVDQVAAPEAPLPSESAEREAERARRLSAVRSALSLIKEPDRTWVELHHTHGVPYDDIAADAGISRAAVK